MRQTASNPRYPSLAALSVLASACAATPLAAAPAPVVVVPIAAEGTASEAPIPRQVDPALELASPAFAEDTAPLPIVGCGGGCPPAYVLSTESKDESQLEARLRYCVQEGLKHWPRMDGTVSVTAAIDESGRALDVTTEQEGSVREEVTDCVERLARSARFSDKNHFGRSASASVPVKAD